MGQRMAFHRSWTASRQFPWDVCWIHHIDSSRSTPFWCWIISWKFLRIFCLSNSGYLDECSLNRSSGLDSLPKENLRELLWIVHSHSVEWLLSFYLGTCRGHPCCSEPNSCQRVGWKRSILSPSSNRRKLDQFGKNAYRCLPSFPGLADWRCLMILWHHRARCIFESYQAWIQFEPAPKAMWGLVKNQFTFCHSISNFESNFGYPDISTNSILDKPPPDFLSQNTKWPIFGTTQEELAS